MLKLNYNKEIQEASFNRNSNTTLVKVKLKKMSHFLTHLLYSNTTLVKVKFALLKKRIEPHPYSNTTLVKVKCQ